MEFTLREWDRGFSPGALEELAGLWNRNAVGRHAFYPWKGDRLSSLLSESGNGIGKIIDARNEGGDLAGFVHVTMLNEEGYPRAGAVESLMVDARFRNRGVGTALLSEAVKLLEAQRPRPVFIDALGAWPYGYAYNVLADGSERSGVFMREDGLYRLFRRAKFEPTRKSLVMRADLGTGAPRPAPAGAGFHIGKRAGATWLDKVFRGRELWDHDMSFSDGRLLSRAIFGFMEGESRHEGRAVFSLFGVNTPGERQNRGYAGINLSHLLAHIRGLGGEAVELHVYADNAPARALYKGLGFREVAETMMMHRNVG